MRSCVPVSSVPHVDTHIPRPLHTRDPAWTPCSTWMEREDGQSAPGTGLKSSSAERAPSRSPWGNEGEGLPLHCLIVAPGLPVICSLSLRRAGVPCDSVLFGVFLGASGCSLSIAGVTPMSCSDTSLTGDLKLHWAAPGLPRGWASPGRCGPWTRHPRVNVPSTHAPPGQRPRGQIRCSSTGLGSHRVTPSQFPEKFTLLLCR